MDGRKPTSASTLGTALIDSAKFASATKLAISIRACGWANHNSRHRQVEPEILRCVSLQIMVTIRLFLARATRWRQRSVGLTPARGLCRDSRHWRLSCNIFSQSPIPLRFLLPRRAELLSARAIRVPCRSFFSAAPCDWEPTAPTLSVSFACSSSSLPASH